MESPEGRRMCIYAGVQHELNSPNLQHTTLTIIVSSVISTWVLLHSTRSFFMTYFVKITYNCQNNKKNILIWVLFYNMLFVCVSSYMNPPCIRLPSRTFYWERKFSFTSSFQNPKSITSPSANQEDS